MFKSGLSSQSAGHSSAPLGELEEDDGVFSAGLDCEGREGSLSACRVLVENRNWRIGLLVNLIRHCQPS